MRITPQVTRTLELFPEAVIWLASDDSELRRTDDASTMIGEASLLEAVGDKGAARLRRAITGSRNLARPRRGIALHVAGGRVLDATVRAGEDETVIVLRDVTRYLRRIAVLQEAAERDSLTGLLNRRGFHASAGMEIARSARHQRALSLALVDVDRFKELNDSLGHATGDAVLAAIGKLLSFGRPGDIVARLGGDEFALLLPETEAVGAELRLRRGIADLRAAFSVETTRVTFSAGVVELQPGMTLETALVIADEALYRAKRGGRGRVVVA